MINGLKTLKFSSVHHIIMEVLWGLETRVFKFQSRLSIDIAREKKIKRGFSFATTFVKMCFIGCSGVICLKLYWQEQFDPCEKERKSYMTYWQEELYQYAKDLYDIRTEILRYVWETMERLQTKMMISLWTSFSKDPHMPDRKLWWLMDTWIKQEQLGSMFIKYS